MGSAKRHTELRQEQITPAALPLVAGDGVQELNMADLARRVGLVQSGRSLYLVVTLSPSCLRINSAKGFLTPMGCFAEFTLNAARDPSLRSE